MQAFCIISRRRFDTIVVLLVVDAHRMAQAPSLAFKRAPACACTLLIFPPVRPATRVAVSRSSTTGLSSFQWHCRFFLTGQYLNTRRARAATNPRYGYTVSPIRRCRDEHRRVRRDLLREVVHRQPNSGRCPNGRGLKPLPRPITVLIYTDSRSSTFSEHLSVVSSPMECEPFTWGLPCVHEGTLFCTRGGIPFATLFQTVALWTVRRIFVVY